MVIIQFDVSFVNILYTHGGLQYSHKCQPLSSLPHHWLMSCEIYLMVDIPRLHTLSLLKNITRRRQSSPRSRYKISHEAKRRSLFFDICQRLYLSVLLCFRRVDSVIRTIKDISVIYLKSFTVWHILFFILFT